MMNEYTDTIPDWNADGVLPPINEDNPTAVERSPYPISLPDLVTFFGNTEERRNLLGGLLDYRAELHKAGLTQGFQWINGSFVEHVEELRERPPADIDVVTFCYIPEGHTQQSLFEAYSNLFDTSYTKAHFNVDAHYVPLNQTTSETVVRDTRYWYSLWAHTRDGQWKGFVQVDIDGRNDSAARDNLDGMNNENGGRA